MLLSRITPQLRTCDLEGSIRFYTEKVGLALDFRYADFYAGIRAGDQVFHLKQVDSPDPSIAFVEAGDHLHLYLGTEDVDAVATLLQANGVALRQEPTDTAWQTRELVFLDDQGHTIYVGQSREGAAVQATADQILELERAALDRWGKGDPDGFLELYGADITYFDPSTAARIDGHPAMAEYYRPWVGKIHIERYEMLDPQVVVDGDMALLTYNLVNYIRDAQGAEAVGSRWNSTTVFRRREGSWRSIHSHWSYTRHPAFQSQTPEASEGLTGG